MFDLPVKTTTERKHYAQFRSLLLKNGFSQLQYSVYARYYLSEEAAEPVRRRIEESVPRGGYVRMLTVTDKQFGKMQSFFGKKRVESEQPPEQMLLF